MLAGAGFAHAQPLADPTRPPNVVQGAAAAEEAPANQLQSVLLSPTRKLAVINGETVPLGGKYRDATLVRITATEVVLKSGTQTETLKLFPGVEKKPMPSRTPPARRSTP
jgi:MSHA biogenesis protein MshK